MKRLILFLFILLLVVTSIMFCGYQLNNSHYKTVDFTYLKQTNRITISTFNVNGDGNKKELCKTKTIDDAMKAESIISKIQTHTHNWQYEKFSPPWTSSFGRLSPIEITFYKNEMREVTLTIGYLDGFGYFLQQTGGLGKHLNVEELDEIISLIGIDKKAVYNQNSCN